MSPSHQRDHGGIDQSNQRLMLFDSEGRDVAALAALDVETGRRDSLAQAPRVDIRGSAGFGKRYLNAQQLEWGGKMHEDVLQQVDWAAERGLIDRDRVAILGGSYGGYEVFVGMTMTPDAFACGVGIVGPSNLERYMPHWSVERMSKVVGDPRTEEGRAHLRARSPINFASQTKHPMLIGQGPVVLGNRGAVPGPVPWRPGRFD